MTDENGNKVPWLAYASIATAIIVPMVGLTIWLAQLGGKVDTLQTRGSPAAMEQLGSIRDQLAVIQERQRVVMEELKNNADRHKILQAQIEALQRSIPLKQ